MPVASAVGVSFSEFNEEQQMIDQTALNMVMLALAPKCATSDSQSIARASNPDSSKLPLDKAFDGNVECEDTVTCSSPPLAAPTVPRLSMSRLQFAPDVEDDTADVLEPADPKVDGVSPRHPRPSWGVVISSRRSSAASSFRDSPRVQSPLRRGSSLKLSSRGLSERAGLGAGFIPPMPTRHGSAKSMAERKTLRSPLSRSSSRKAVTNADAAATLIAACWRAAVIHHAFSSVRMAAIVVQSHARRWEITMALILLRDTAVTLQATEDPLHM